MIAAVIVIGLLVYLQRRGASMGRNPHDGRQEAAARVNSAFHGRR